MKQSKIVGPYIINGFIIGLLFPLFSYIFCFYFLSPSDSTFSFISLHTNYPLLWIINLAPLILGFISYLVGNNVNNINEHFVDEIKVANDKLQRKNDQLEDYIHEKEVLIKEIHHRVKNNLQVITSLLSLQSSIIEDEESKTIFMHCQNRIHSMALIHEMLYQSNNFSKIDFNIYTTKLISELINSMTSSEENISYTISIENIELNINTAIPLGLLINEIVTNSLKYGFKNQSSGLISIELHHLKEKGYKMVIGDNGEGFSDDITFKNAKSLGLMLIQKLTIQLRGIIKREKELIGTNYTLLFKEID